jgi:hypothetical protein
VTQLVGEGDRAAVVTLGIVKGIWGEPEEIAGSRKDQDQWNIFCRPFNDISSRAQCFTSDPCKLVSLIHEQHI